MTSIGHEAIRKIGIVFPHLQKNEKNEIVAKEKATLATQMFIGIDS